MMLNSTPVRVLVLTAVAAALALLTTAVIRPSLVYDPRTESGFDALAGSPAQLAKAIWLESVASVGETVEAQRVRLTNGSSLLISLLDDDPTCSAVVDLAVTTAQGQTRSVVIFLWDYGMVLPWSYRPQGDGWKLMSAAGNSDRG